MWREKTNAYNFWSESHPDDDVQMGRYYLNVFLGNRVGACDWIHLAKHRDKWQALVNTARNLQVQ
jgi:hypothetical protein